MMKLKRKYFYKEMIIIPIIFIFTGLILKFNKFNPDALTSKIFLARDESILENLKLYVTTFSIIMFVEYMLIVKLPNNFFFSRFISLLIMMVIFILTSLVLNLKFDIYLNKTGFILLFVSSVLVGQIVSFIIVSKRYFKKLELVSLVSYFLIYIILILNSFFNFIVL